MTGATGTRPTAAPRAAGALRNGFRERVITPPDADYDKARALWNGAIDKRPALIARCDPDNVCRLNHNIEPAPADGRTHGGRG